MADAPTEPTFGGGPGPWIVDTEASQAMGAATQGIGIAGVDGADIGASRIGTDAGTDVIVDTDGDLATPE